jgi:hypothetical protein
MTLSADSLRLQFRETIAARGFVADEMWRKPCLGYNIRFAIPVEVGEKIVQLQRQVVDLEPNSLLVCPPPSLHISVASILSVRADYEQTKDEIWKEIQRRCCVALSEVALETAPFVIDFRHLVVTDTAVILFGTDDGSMARLRRRICRVLPVSDPAPTIIHVTAFRYSRGLEDPDAFVDAVEGLSFKISVPVDNICIEKEFVYPSIKSETHFSVSFGKG